MAIAADGCDLVSMCAGAPMTHETLLEHSPGGFTDKSRTIRVGTRRARSDAMLATFIKSNREEVIARTRAQAAGRTAPQPSDEELNRGIPLFLDQLVGRLRGETPNGSLCASATTQGKEMRQ